MEPDKLTTNVRRVLSSPTEAFYVSAVSGFEIAQKVGKGKLILPQPPSQWMVTTLKLHVLEALDLDMNSAVVAGSLPALHADPFDRLLIATAQNARLTLLTPDPWIRQYPQAMTYW